MIGETVRKVIAAVFIVGAVATVYVTYQETRPCASPIAYRVGTIDSRFKISKETFTQNLEKAGDIWETAAQKTLFVHDNENGDVVVNLIFDSRQQTANLGVSISSQQASYEQRKAEIQAEKIAYDKATAAYEKEVTAWNTRHGYSGSTSEYQTLETQRAALVRQKNALNEKIDALNNMARALNVQVNTYNAAADTFEQGLYYRNASGTGIDVYEFTSEKQLIRLLAHEFGHALGLEHVENTSAIMYPINNGTSLALSTEDRAALKELCGM